MVYRYAVQVIGDADDGDIECGIRLQHLGKIMDLRRSVLSNCEGYCQGINCQPTISAMLDREYGADQAAINMLTTRPPARPIPLSLLMMDLEKFT